MALGAALATGRPQAYTVVPGPGLLNSAAALLTAYGMNAPVLGADRPDRPVGDRPRASAICTRSATRPASSPGWSISPRASARRRGRGPRRRGVRARWRTGRPGPAVLECAIDVWGRSAPVHAIAGRPCQSQPPIDEDAIRDCRQAPGRRQAPADRGRRRRAGRQPPRSPSCRACCRRRCWRYRRGRGVLDSRDPLSVTLPLGRELWGEADVVLGVGTPAVLRLHPLGRRRRAGDHPRRRRSRGAGALPPAGGRAHRRCRSRSCAA